MPNSKIQDALNALESRVHKLEKSLSKTIQVNGTQSDVPWWKRIVGKFENDEVFDEVAKEIRKKRRAEYAALRKRQGA